MKRRNLRAGFTLVELLVVIAIISLLAGLLVPTVSLARKKGQQAACLNQLKQIGSVSQVFAGENRDWYPFDRKQKEPLAYESLQILADWDPSTVSPRLFVCQTHRDDIALVENGKYTLDDKTCSYTWISERRNLSDKPDLPLSSDDKMARAGSDVNEGHDRGVNVVYIGGTAEFLSSTEIPEDRMFPVGLMGNIR